MSQVGLARRIAGTVRAMPDVESFVHRSMREYLAAHPEDEYARRSYPFDALRLTTSLRWLEKLELRGRDILELGGQGIASFVLEGRFPDNRWVRSGFDLREPFPLDDAAFDVVLCMEVIEHVADLQYAHATVLSGVRRCLAEMHRVLRVGGKAFLTTPNAASLVVLRRALDGGAPWFYPWHFRELTVAELRLLVEEAGLHVADLRTEYVWSSETDEEPLRQFMRAQGHDLEQRGDDIFLLVERRAEPPASRGLGELGLPI